MISIPQQGIKYHSRSFCSEFLSNMAPLGGILRFLTMIVTPVLGRFVNDPNIVNKMSNSTPMRIAARLAVRLKIKYEDMEKEKKVGKKGEDGKEQRGEDGKEQRGEDRKEQDQTDNGSTKERISRVRSRTQYEQTAEKLKFKRKR